MKTNFSHCTERLCNFKWALIYVLPILLVFSLETNAQTNYYYDGSGSVVLTSNWNTNPTGSGGVSPSNFTTANQIFIVGNSNTSSLTYTLTSNWSISGAGSQLIIPNGTTFTDAFIVSTPTLTIQSGGIFQNNSIANVSTAFNINDGGTYIHNTTTTISTSIFAGTESFGPNSNFKINNWQSTSVNLISNLTASAQPGDGNSYYYGNLEINWSTNSGTWAQGFTASSYNLCAGNFTITSTGTSSGIMAFTTNKQPVMRVYGDFNINGGILWWGTGNGGGVSAYPEFWVGGNVSQTGGDFNTSGNQMQGGIVSDGGVSNNSIWTFSGGTRQKIYFIINSPKTVTLGSDFDMGSSLSGTSPLQINSGATFDAVNYLLSYSASSNVSIYGTIKTANANGLFRGSATTLINSGSVYLQPAFQSGSTVEYNAIGSQYITDTSNYENVTISGGGTKTLIGASTINKTLLLSNGKLDVQNYILTMASAGNISGYSSSNYIITGSNTGRLKQNSLSNVSAKVFPVGTSTCYMPALVKPTTAGLNYSVNVFTGATTNGLYNGTAWTSSQKKGMVDAVWNVERSTISNVTDIVTFQWDNCYGSLEGPTFSTAANTDIGIWYWASGTSWSLASTAFSSNNSNAGGLNTSANSGTFRYASVSGSNSHYIVALTTATLEFESVNLLASLKNKEVALSWKTEDLLTAIKSFEVERSFDRNHFVGIASRQYVNNSSFNYSDAISDVGVVYYRIKMISQQGTISYSNVASVNTGSSVEVRLLTNPVTTEAVLLHPAADQANYRLLGIDGRVLISGIINKVNTLTKINIQSLAKGVYTLQYIRNNEVTNIKMVK